MNAWGIDIYDPQWARVKDHLWEFRKADGQAGMTFLIWKGPMGLGNSPKAFLDEANAFAKDAGLLRGIYGWMDPIYPLQPQIDRFKQLIDTYDPDFVAGDFEQWWSSWSQYWDYLNGKISGDAVGVLDGNRVADFGQAYMEKLTALGIFALVYTARWFVEGYVWRLLDLFGGAAPAVNIDRIFAGMPMIPPTGIMANRQVQPVPSGAWRGLTVANKAWLSKYPLWDADYYKLKTSGTMYTWDALWNLIALVPDLGPSMPQWTERKMRQWTSAIVLPNMPAGARTDMNFWSGSEKEMGAYLGAYVPPDPPTPVSGIEMTVIVDKVNVRSGPVITPTNIIGSVVRGDKVTVSGLRFDAGNWWAQIGAERWCAMEYGGQQYLT